MMLIALPILLLALQTNPSSVPAPAPDAAAVPQAPIAPAPSDPPAHKVGGNVLPPKVLYTVVPQYTKAARKARIEGASMIRLIVDAHGNPTNIHVVGSMADKVDKTRRDAALSLDQAAMDSVAQYRFAPATMNGRPVPVIMNVEVNFQLF